jgi:hypothetical protein
MRRNRTPALAVVLATLALAGGACSDSSGTGRWRGWRPQPAESSPAADSPENALRLLEWCWNHLDTTAYRDLFTDDYRFTFSLSDTGGSGYRDTTWTREDELASFNNMASRTVSVSVALDRNFRVALDPRYPNSGRWRKLIRTSAFLRLVDADGGQADVSGYPNFFLVRGDSAAIPVGLVARGVWPDSTRWYVQRWEDDCQEYGSRATPASKACWGSIKLRYRATPRSWHLGPGSEQTSSSSIEPMNHGFLVGR